MNEWMSLDMNSTQSNRWQAKDATFFADAQAVNVWAGDLVSAGARGGAVGPVEACGTADGAVVALRTEAMDTDHTADTTVPDRKICF